AVPVRRIAVRFDGGPVALPRVAGAVLRGLHPTGDGRPHLGAAPAPLDSPSARRDPDALAIRRTTHLVSLIRDSRSAAACHRVRTTHTQLSNSGQCSPNARPATLGGDCDGR